MSPQNIMNLPEINKHAPHQAHRTQQLWERYLIDTDRSKMVLDVNERLSTKMILIARSREYNREE